MKALNLRKKLHMLWNHRATFLLSLMVIFLTGISATMQTNAVFILTGAEDSAIILDNSAKKKVPDLSAQMVNVTSGSKGYDITLSTGQMVNIHHGDTTLAVQARRESISKLLDRLMIVPGPLEMIAMDFSDSTIDLTITSDFTYYDKVTETVAYSTLRVPNPEMTKGTEKVVQEGVDGVRTSIYEVVWANGQQVSRQFVEELDSTVVDEIIEYGTSTKEVANSDPVINITKNADGSGILHFQSGAALEFSEAKSMTATAYTAGYDGADYTTATGTFVRIGVVAVDKKVIPLGTRMYIVTDDGIVYGLSVAEDTGVKGNKVDLYHETYEQCINFGRRACTVYILK